MREHYLARSKQQVLKDLPPKTTTISTLYVPNAPDIEDFTTPPKEPKAPPANATPTQLAAHSAAMRIYEDRLAGFREDREMYREAVGDDPSSMGGPTVGEYSRIRGELAEAKAPATVDMVKEILNGSDSKVLVFSESVAAAKKIAEDLGDVAILHHGQQSDDLREASKKEFQREGSPKRVFVSTRPSLAVGATLTAADKVVFNDLPWTAADIQQAEDRVHRIGQQNNVNVYWVVAEDNKFDENVTAILRRKYDLAAKINAGRQLSPEEKAWMDKPLTIAEALGKTVKGKDKPAKKAKAVVEKAPKLQSPPPALKEAATAPTPVVTPAARKPAPKLSPQQHDRLRQIEGAGRLALKTKHRGPWFQGYDVDRTLQALIDRGLAALVTLKHEGITAGGQKPQYAKLTDAGRALLGETEAPPALKEPSTAPSPVVTPAAREEAPPTPVHAAPEPPQSTIAVHPEHGPQPAPLNPREQLKLFKARFGHPPLRGP
jgi:hypothetical protein